MSDNTCFFLFWRSSDYGKALHVSNNIIKLLERKPSINNNSDQGLKLVYFIFFSKFYRFLQYFEWFLKAKCQGNIQLNVNSFMYPAQPNVQVLKNLQLNIQSGIIKTNKSYNTSSIFDFNSRTEHCFSWCVSDN